MACLWSKYQPSGEVTTANFAWLPDFGADLKTRALKEGEARAELAAVSVDPYMRGRMRDTPGYFAAPFQPGQPVESGGIVKITESKVPGVAAGAFYSGMMPWQSTLILGEEQLKGMQVVDLEILKKANLPVSSFLGVLGMTGMTAYGSITKIGKPKAGETVFISGASGAVGMVVADMCKNVYGCRVVGSCGSDEKAKMLTEDGHCDAAYNYKTTAHGEALDKLCPNGIDIYFDNVGGETLEAALDRVNKFARVVACGMISQYDKAPSERYGVKNLTAIVFKEVTMQGFLVFSFLPEILEGFYTDMPQWIASGKVQPQEYTLKGLANGPQAFVDMMSGKNKGKAVVQCLDKDPITGQ